MSITDSTVVDIGYHPVTYGGTQCILVRHRGTTVVCSEDYYPEEAKEPEKLKSPNFKESRKLWKKNKKIHLGVSQKRVFRGKILNKMRFRSQGKKGR